MCISCWQANAEPDLQQTGDRLKGVIGGLVEGTLELVAGPLERQNGKHCQVIHSNPISSQAAGF